MQSKVRENLSELLPWTLETRTVRPWPLNSKRSVFDGKVEHLFHSSMEGQQHFNTSEASTDERKHERNSQRSFSNLGYSFQSNLFVNSTKDIQEFECDLKFDHQRRDTYTGSFRNDWYSEPAIPVLSGWITKKTKARIFGLRMFQDWKASWYVVKLQAGNLVLDRFCDDQYAIPNKSFHLCPINCAIREAQLDSSGRHCFSVAVIGRSERITLGASSRQQADQWVDKLTFVAGEPRCTAAAKKRF